MVDSSAVPCTKKIRLCLTAKSDEAQCPSRRASAASCLQPVTTGRCAASRCAARRPPGANHETHRQLGGRTCHPDHAGQRRTCRPVSITDRREKELSDLGFIALIYRKNSDKAAFFSGQTVHKPPVYTSDTANANARISARLPYLLNASRFAHYVKANMRDKVGSFMTADNVSKYLNNWISQYVLLSDDAGDDIKARYPLREARVDVSEDPGNPGAYKCVIFLRPHFQLEELTASIRLVAELPPPAV